MQNLRKQKTTFLGSWLNSKYKIHSEITNDIQSFQGTTTGIQWQHNKRKSVIRIIYTQRTDGGWDTDEKWDVKTNQQKVKATRVSGEDRQGTKLIFK